MLHATVIIEDTVIVGSGRLIPYRSEVFDVLISDLHTGKQRRVEMTFVQFSAVLALAMGMGEDGTIGKEATARLYEIARPLVTGEGWEGLTPIP